MTITKIPAGRMRGNFVQGFGVEILYPGLALTADDSGIGPIGRIDRAQVQPGHLIGMHPHQDDAAARCFTAIRSETRRSTTGSIS